MAPETFILTDLLAFPLFAPGPAHRLLARIGKVSFSIYIMHFIFAWGAVPAMLNRLSFGSFAESFLFAPLFVIVSCICVVLGERSWRYVEHPMIVAGQRVIDSIGDRERVHRGTDNADV